MAVAFPAPQVTRILRDARRLVKQAREQGHNPQVWTVFKNRVIQFGTEQLAVLWQDVVTRELQRRGIERVPPIITLLLRRYQERWRQLITIAFAQAEDSARRGGRSIYSRVGQIVAQAEATRILAEGGSRPGFTASQLRRLRRLGTELPQEIYGAVRAAPGLGRRTTIRFVPYLRTLLQTVPRDLHRDVMKRIIQAFEDRDIYMLLGSLMETSCSTCEWAQGKVFDTAALHFLQHDRRLRNNIFHPHCRHRIASAPRRYTGQVWNEADTLAAARTRELLR